MRCGRCRASIPRPTSSPTGSRRSSTSTAAAGPNEWESRSPSWETRPALALAAIDRMRQAPDSADPAGHHAERAAEREAASAELLAMVEADPATHGQLAAAIGCSKAWLPGRERTKTNNIRVIHEMRIAMREIGRRMVEAGAFDEIEDFGFVRKAEMAQLFADPHVARRASCATRRAEYMQLEQLEPPFVFVGRADGPEHVASAATRWLRTASPPATCWPACPAARDRRRASPGWCSTPTIRSRSSPATSSSRRSPTRRGRRCSCRRRAWSSMSAHRSAMPSSSAANWASRASSAPPAPTRRIPNGARIRVDGSTGVVTVLELP